MMMRENGFPRDRHAKTTRIKKSRERQKTGFVQELGLYGGFVQVFRKTMRLVFFCPSMQSVVMGVDQDKKGERGCR
jgi:hypothetical protein